MSIHHSIDFTLEIFDSLTGSVLKGGHGLFYLNGLPLKPSKVVASFMIFSNVFKDHKIVHVKDNPPEHQLTWVHPLYEPVAMTIKSAAQTAPEQPILVPARPSAVYPVMAGTTGIKGNASADGFIRAVHSYNANRFHLQEVLESEGRINLSQSLSQRLSGKLLRLTSGDLKPATIRLGAQDDKGFSFELLEGTLENLSVEADIFELLEVPIRQAHEFILLFKDIKTDTSDLTVGVEWLNLSGQVVKAQDIAIEKGVLTRIDT